MRDTRARVQHKRRAVKKRGEKRILEYTHRPIYTARRCTKACTRKSA